MPPRGLSHCSGCDTSQIPELLRELAPGLLRVVVPYPVHNETEEGGLPHV